MVQHIRIMCFLCLICKLTFCVSFHFCFPFLPSLWVSFSLLHPVSEHKAVPIQGLGREQEQEAKPIAQTCLPRRQLAVNANKEQLFAWITLSTFTLGSNVINLTSVFYCVLYACWFNCPFPYIRNNLDGGNRTKQPLSKIITYLIFSFISISCHINLEPSSLFLPHYMKPITSISDAPISVSVTWHEKWAWFAHEI